jgi:hypothetical protein
MAALPCPRRPQGVWHPQLARHQPRLLDHAHTCTCYDARERHHECKHMLAVRLHCELVAEQQLPKADLSRILGGSAPCTPQQRGVIPASQIERED